MFKRGRNDKQAFRSHLTFVDCEASYSKSKVWRAQCNPWSSNRTRRTGKPPGKPFLSWSMSLVFFNAGPLSVLQSRKYRAALPLPKLHLFALWKPRCMHDQPVLCKDSSDCQSIHFWLRNISTQTFLNHPEPIKYCRSTETRSPKMTTIRTKVDDHTTKPKAPVPPPAHPSSIPPHLYVRLQGSPCEHMGLDRFALNRHRSKLSAGYLGLGRPHINPNLHALPLLRHLFEPLAVCSVQIKSALLTGINILILTSAIDLNMFMHWFGHFWFSGFGSSPGCIPSLPDLDNPLESAHVECFRHTAVAWNCTKNSLQSSVLHWTDSWWH